MTDSLPMTDTPITEKMDELRRLANVAKGAGVYDPAREAFAAAASPDVILALLDRASSPARSAEGGGNILERLKAAYDKVREWPENRMREDAVLELGEGFTDLLSLRNLIPETIAALTAPDRSAEGLVTNEMIAAAWKAWHSRHGGKLGPGPAFVEAIKAALSAQPGTEAEAGETMASFQDRVQPWMMACFGPEISADKLERGDRFLEEALELVQSGNYPKERVYALVEYVYGRDQGEINQEVGGVMVTLAAYCLAHGLDMHTAGETELARIWTKVEKIRAKQAAKPTGSALPVAVAAPVSIASRVQELEKALEPFAKAAETLDRLVLAPDFDHWPMSNDQLGDRPLTLGDLRRARATLTAKEA